MSIEEIRPDAKEFLNSLQFYIAKPLIACMIISAIFWFFVTLTFLLKYEFPEFLTSSWLITNYILGFATVLLTSIGILISLKWSYKISKEDIEAINNRGVNGNIEDTTQAIFTASVLPFINITTAVLYGICITLGILGMMLMGIYKVFESGFKKMFL